MSSYTFKFSQTRKFLPALLLGNIIMVGIIFLGQQYFNPPNPVFNLFVLCDFAIGFGGMYYLSKKMIPVVKVKLNDGLLYVDFYGHSFFRPSSFTVPLEDVKNISLDTYAGSWWIDIGPHCYPFSFNIQAVSKKQQDKEQLLKFATEINNEILLKNSKGQGTTFISSTRRLQKASAVFVIVALVIYFILRLIKGQ